LLSTGEWGKESYLLPENSDTQSYQIEDGSDLKKKERDPIKPKSILLTITF